MRNCPSVDGSATPLITHRIDSDVCMARQRTFFHKCHRCIYRGKAADWEPAEPPMTMINVHAAEEPGPQAAKPVSLPTRGKPAKKAAAKACDATA
jgi:hypothetical protein